MHKYKFLFNDVNILLNDEKLSESDNDSEIIKEKKKKKEEKEKNKNETFSNELMILL